MATAHRLANQGGGDRPVLPKFYSIRWQLQRAKSSMQPQIPDSIEDVEIDGPWGQTWMGEEFLLRNHARDCADRCDWDCFIFATEENLRVLQQCRDLYIDATFRTCPEPFSQVLTIMGNYHGRHLTLVNCLMGQRTVGHYRHLMKALKRKIRQLTHNRFNPTNIVCDFEIPLLNAVQTEFPRSRHSGCYFHFCQCLWRKIQELGLARTYKQDLQLQKVIRKFMAIGYLPVVLVRNNFNILSQSRRVQNMVGIYDALNDWIGYIRNNYINGQFRPILWNVYERNMDMRTNNWMESKSICLVVIIL